MTALKADSESNSTIVNTFVIFIYSNTIVISWHFPFVLNQYSLAEKEQTPNTQLKRYSSCLPIMGLVVKFPALHV